MTNLPNKFSPAIRQAETVWDVIVVGGGPSGCTAATAAAREDAKTLLIESTGVLGGSGTNALVPAWCPFSDREKIIYRGLAQKVFDDARVGMKHVNNDWVDWRPIDAERLKVVYDNLVTGAGATILFHTMLSAVNTDGDETVTKIVVTNKAGLSELKAKVFVDSTGDADLAAWAGAEFHCGDAYGATMPATHCFVLTNVDDNAFRHVYKNGNALERTNPTSPIYKIIESGRYPLILDCHICCTTIGPKTVGFNAGHIWDVDSTNPDSVSKALIHGRKMAASYRDALAEFCPDAFGSAFLVSTGSVVGIRESRRVIGDYVLTLDDYLARRSFDDEICRNSYFIDVHQSLKEMVQTDAARSASLEHMMRYNPGESHGIPYRCLTPRGLLNVLVAGRSISCDRPVQGSVRVMPVCLAMGEAAGLAAALASKSDGNTHKVDTKDLRRRLLEYGAYLP
jgi:thiol-disulfide isomerase/thioredoxin